MERHYGKIHRTIPLAGKVEKEKVVAEYHEGILKVTLPKVEASEIKRIP